MAGGWRIFQLRRGHRFATDDVLVAWTACRAQPQARRLLDLGAGVGSIGLMALLRMADDARLTTIEVQPPAVALQRKTVALNKLEDRVDIRLGDLRTLTPAELDGPFDLITANPPFLPPERARRSPDPSRAFARLELHGDVFDFCRAAATHLAPDGRFCFCHAAADPRAERAASEAGLSVRSRQRIIFRHGRPPAIALFTCAWQGERTDLPPLTVRGPDRLRTAEYRGVRREMLIEA